LSFHIHIRIVNFAFIDRHVYWIFVSQS